MRFFIFLRRFSETDHQYLFSGLQVFLVVLSTVSTVQAQDPVFSQFYSSRLFYNPGFSGSSEEGKVAFTYRNQWSASSTKFENTYAAFDMPVDLLHGGVGFYLLNDRASNILNNFHVSAIYNYHLRVSRDFYVQAGFQVSVNQRKLAMEQLIFPDMIDPSAGVLLPTQEVLGDGRKIYMDYSFGFVGFSGDWFGGLAIHHLSKPKLSDSDVEGSELPRKFTVHLARNIPLTKTSRREDAWVITPEVMLQNQGTFYYGLLGVVLTKKPVHAGLHARQDFRFDQTTVIFSLGYSNKFIGFTYSYDVAISKYQSFNPSQGAHEIGLIVNIPSGKKTKTIDAINLPVY